LPKKSAADEAAYSVHRSQDGAQIVTDVSLDVAQSERARLNAEARVVVGRVLIENQYVEQYAGMYHGEIVRYEIRTKDGLTV
jgi:hypothetical protein